MLVWLPRKSWIKHFLSTTRNIHSHFLYLFPQTRSDRATADTSCSYLYIICCTLSVLLIGDCTVIRKPLLR
jgi:hypothetical protein